MRNNNAADVDTYIALFPAATRQAMKQVRAAIYKAAPQAREVISYGMPGFKVNKTLLYFCGYARHIGLYPGAAAILAFKEEISQYKSAKGSVQLPLDKPMPVDLITRITAFRLAEDAKKALPGGQSFPTNEP